MKYVHMVSGDLVDAVYALSRSARKVQDAESTVAETAKDNVIPLDKSSR